MIHDLQKDIEEIGMGFFDFIEQQHAMRMLIDAIGEQATLIETDIARRCADETRDCVAFHIFRHVETQYLDTEDRRQLARDFGFADARWAGEQVGADWLFGFAQTGTRQFDRCRQRRDGRILSEDNTLQLDVEVFQLFRIGLRHGLGRNARHCRNHIFDFSDADCFLAARLRQKHLRGACFVDHVDGLIRQFAVVHIF